MEASLREYGAGRSIVLDRHGTVIVGNQTWATAQRLGLPIQTVRTAGDTLIAVQRTDLDLGVGDRARALAIADNRIGELNLAWDADMLRGLHADGLPLPGFTDDELEALFGAGLHPGQTADDHVVLPGPSSLAVGTLVALGRHRLLCGDATQEEAVTQLLAGVTPTLMVTDPPYGVTYDPAWRTRAGLGAGAAVGDVLNDDRADWTPAFALFTGDVVYAWHAGLHASAVATALSSAGYDIRAQLIWCKQHFALGRGDYHWQHEPCFYAVRRGRPSHWRGGRTQSTVWTVPNLNPLGGTRDGENVVTGHATQKPVALFERAILHHTRAGEALYDPFVGSGTAVIAAEKTGRTAYVMDLDPRYVQVTIDRWEAYTGQRAVLLPDAEPHR